MNYKIKVNAGGQLQNLCDDAVTEKPWGMARAQIRL